jgi:hypothetical protein
VQVDEAIDRLEPAGVLHLDEALERAEVVAEREPAGRLDAGKHARREWGRWVLLLNSPFPLIGGYPGVYGLIGAFTFLMWVDAGMRGENQMRAFGLIGALLAIQILFGVIQGISATWWRMSRASSQGS